MSLGGLVVALGVVVDDAVIDVENITRRRRAPPARPAISRTLLLDASLEVRRPVFYATAAVAVAFLPILMLSGLQGAFFRPLATAFLLAVGSVAAGGHERDPSVVRAADEGYRPRDGARGGCGAPSAGSARRSRAWQRTPRWCWRRFW